MSIETQIRRFIDEQLLEGTNAEGDPISDGLLDSMALEQLIAFLEDRYQIAFDDSELVAERFASIQTVASLVKEKRSSRSRVRWRTTSG